MSKAHYKFGMKPSLEELVEARSRLSLLAEAIKVFGPRSYTALAGATGLSVQSVRYKVRSQLLGRGLKVQVHVDHGRLGLARYRLMVRFANCYEDANVKVLDWLANSGYLEYYGRMLPRGDYLAWLGLPPNFENHYRVFLDRLVEMGIFKRYSMSRVSWIRYFSMRSDCYDFKSGVWHFSWDSLPSRRVEDISLEEDVVSPSRLDSLDLRITALLQVDASIPISELSKRLGIPYKRVLYHFKKHVLEGGLLKRYILRWQGGLEGTHSLTYLFVWVNGLSHGELEDVKSTFSRIPFTCFDTYEAGRSIYTAYITAPVSQLQQCLSYIWRSLPDVRSRISYVLLDPKCSKAFAIPVGLYRDDGKWVFSVEGALKSVSWILKTVKNNGGRAGSG